MSMNSKSLLGVFITKYIKTCCSKQNIKYATEQFGHQYQTTITLVSLGKHQGKPPLLFASELCSNKQEAEFSAAQKALGAHADDLSPSIFLSFYLSPYLSISLSLSRSFSLSLSLSLCLSLSVYEISDHNRSFEQSPKASPGLGDQTMHGDRFHQFSD